MTGMSPEEVIEQKHAMAGLAEIFRSYYEELRGQGFSRTEAMRIMLAYQSEIVRGTKDS